MPLFARKSYTIIGQPEQMLCRYASKNSGCLKRLCVFWHRRSGTKHDRKLCDRHGKPYCAGDYRENHDQNGADDKPARRRGEENRRQAFEIPRVIFSLRSSRGGGIYLFRPPPKKNGWETDISVCLSGCRFSEQQRSPSNFWRYTRAVAAISSL